jgi:GH35 family endo-1,4-beta-xylanase
MWGFTDKYSWIYDKEGNSYPDEAPLIFDPEYNPKFAYYGLLARLSEGMDYVFLPVILK